MDALRLAWEAHREGRATRRDALLTLAVADSQGDDLQWVKDAVAFLIKSRADHLFAGFEMLDEALSDRRVMASLDRLRTTFPRGRVQWMVARCDALRGPYRGRVPGINVMIREIIAPPKKHRESLSVASTVPSKHDAGRPNFAGDGLGLPSDADPMLKFYLSTLVATAALLAIVLSDQSESRAA